MTLSSSWHAYDHYGLALIAVVGTLIATVSIQWFIQASRWREWAMLFQGVAPPFINIIGVLFGLTLAFLANDTWSAHDRAMNAVYREADALRSVAALTDTLPAPLRTRVRAALSNYATSCVAEWPYLAQRRQNPEVLAHADALLVLLAGRTVEEAAGRNAQTLMLARASDARADRDLRVALSQTHVNPLKWLGMAFLGFITLVSIAAVHLERPRAAFAAVLLFALAAAPTAAIVLVQGNPFQDPTSVTPKPLEAVSQALNMMD